MSSSRAQLFTSGVRNRTKGDVTRAVQQMRDATTGAEKEREEEFLSGETGGDADPHTMREDLLRAAAAAGTGSRRRRQAGQTATAPSDMPPTSPLASPDRLMIGSMASMGMSLEGGLAGWGSVASVAGSQRGSPSALDIEGGYPSDAAVAPLEGDSAWAARSSRQGRRQGRREPSLATLTSEQLGTAPGRKPTAGRGYAIAGGVARPLAADATVAALVSPFTSVRSHQLAFRGTHSGSATMLAPFARPPATGTQAESKSGKGPPLLRRSVPGLPPAASLAETALPRAASALRAASSARGFVQVPMSTMAALGRGGGASASVAGGGSVSSWRGGEMGVQGQRQRAAEGSLAARSSAGVAIAPLAHTSSELLAGLPQEERKVMMLQEWAQSYEADGIGDGSGGGAGRGAFRSPVLQAELKLTRARIFSGAAPRPADLVTAVAFEVLERVETAAGPLGGVLRVVRRVLAQAVYVEAAAEEETADELVPMSRSVAEASRAVASEVSANRAGAGSGASSFESSAMARYFALTLHASDTARMKEERERVRAVAERLRATLVAWERARQQQLRAESRRTRVVGTWQRLLTKTSAAQTAAARAELAATLEAAENATGSRGRGGGGGLQEARTGGGSGAGAGDDGGEGGGHGRDGDGADSGYGSVAGAVDGILAINSDADRLKALLESLEAMPHLIRDVVRAMLVGKEGQSAALGEAPAAQLALEAVTQRAGGTSVGVLSGLVRGLFRGRGVGDDDPGRRATILSEAIQAAGADGLDALPSMLRLVMQAQGGAWRGTAVRYLTAVDSDMLPPEQVSAHVGGADVDEVRVALPGELGSAVSGFFSREELITLLRDLLDFLGGDALGSCVGAMVDPRGPLNGPMKEDLDRQDRVGLLKLLLSLASVEEVRDAMPAGMLAALGAEAGEGGAAAAAADVAKRVQRNKAAGAEEAARNAALPAEVRSMLRYTRKPPRGLRDKTRLKAERAASLVYEVWAAKAREDTFDDSRGETRQPLGAYTRDYLLQKLGLASLADGALYGLVAAMRKSGENNARLNRFGAMMGVLEPERFSPRRADVFLLLCKLCFPRFTDKTFKNRPLGTCYVMSDIATSALGSLFPTTDGRLPASTERIGLEPDLRAALLADVAEKTIVYGDFVEEHSGGGLAAEPASSQGSRHSRSVATPHRGLRGGPDLALTAHAVDFDWLAERALQAWDAQRERDLRSMKWLFVRHDADGNGVLSLAEFSTLLEDCLTGADGEGAARAAGSFSSTSSMEEGGLPRGKSSRDVQDGSAGPGGLGKRRVLKLFEEVMRLSRQASRARQGGVAKRAKGADVADEDDSDDDGRASVASSRHSDASDVEAYGVADVTE